MGSTADAIKALIMENLGYEVTDKPMTVRNGAVNIIDCKNGYALVTCTEDDQPYVAAMVEMLENKERVKLIVKEKGGRVPAGKGFGDRVWRKNSKHAGIELSFVTRPDEGMRNTLKSLGFRWSRVGGVWYLSLKKVTDAVTTFLVNNGFTEVEAV